MKKNKITLGLVACRGGSKGIPRKNLLKINGKELITIAAEAALSTPEIDQVICSTDSEELADIAISASRVARLFGFDPKVAFLSHSTFGQPITSRTKHIREAVEILKNKNVNFKFDGDMQPDVALSSEYVDLYPFSEIVGNANILIMPGQHSAAISYKIMKALGGAKVIGPLLIGLGQAIEIAPLRSSTSDILNLASVAAYSAGVINYKKIN